MQAIRSPNWLRAVRASSILRAAFGGLKCRDRHNRHCSRSRPLARSFSVHDVMRIKSDNASCVRRRRLQILRLSFPNVSKPRASEAPIEQCLSADRANQSSAGRQVGSSSSVT